MRARNAFDPYICVVNCHRLNQPTAYDLNAHLSVTFTNCTLFFKMFIEYFHIRILFPAIGCMQISYARIISL